MANRSLELDQGMSLVVGVGGTGFAVGAEVQVGTNSTLVPDSTDISRVGASIRAERSITANAHVDRLRRTSSNVSELIIDGYEAMTRMDEIGILNAMAAEVPVRAVKALVADTRDVPVATIADSMVNLVTARRHLQFDVLRHVCALNSRDEGMLGVVAVSVLSEARLAEVVILASGAVKKL